MSHLSEARSELEASSRAVADLEGKKTELDVLTPRIVEVGVQAAEARERSAQYGDKVRQSEALSRERGGDRGGVQAARGGAEG